MRIRTALIAAACIALPLAAAAPAHAYDADKYAYAGGHMLLTSDVPKGLGNFGQGMSFSANSGRSSIELCSPKDSSVSLKGGNAYYSAYFSNGTEAGNSLSESVIGYPSNSAAIKAFNAASAAVKKCVGTQTGSWDDGSGATYNYSSTTTIGKAPAVTVTGVKSVFINTNHIDGSSNSSSKELRDTYLVMTLVDDSVIVTEYNRADDANVSTKLRARVNQAAFNAVTRWVA